MENLEEFKNYKEKQKLFRNLNKKKGTIVWESRSKTVDGGYIGNTYVKENEKLRELESKLDKEKSE